MKKRYVLYMLDESDVPVPVDLTDPQDARAWGEWRWKRHQRCVVAQDPVHAKDGTVPYGIAPRIAAAVARARQAGRSDRDRALAPRAVALQARRSHARTQRARRIMDESVPNVWGQRVNNLASRSPQTSRIPDVRRLVYKAVHVIAMLLPDIPRIYTSFAEFERDERRRLGLPELPELPEAPMPKALAPRAARAEVKPRKPAGVVVGHVTPASLRDEGVLEIGCAPGTSVLYVRTRVKLHVLHATWLPDRQLDDYAVRLAVAWIQDQGLSNGEVAKNLGVSENTLRQALTAGGYERSSPAQQQTLVRARAARKFGNRRGRLVRASAAASTGSCP